MFGLRPPPGTCAAGVNTTLLRGPGRAVVLSALRLSTSSYALFLDDLISSVSSDSLSEKLSVSLQSTPPDLPGDGSKSGSGLLALGVCTSSSSSVTGANWRARSGLSALPVNALDSAIVEEAEEECVPSISLSSMSSESG